MAEIQGNDDQGTSLLPSLVLTEEDIPGAALNEPLQKHTMPALRWWLLCHGIQVPTSCKKPNLIEKIREAKKASTAVIDVDGSYLFRKYEQCGHANMLPVPNSPLAGWDLVSQENYSNIAKNIPTVTHGLLYTYLEWSWRYFLSFK